MKFWLNFAGCCNNSGTTAPLSDAGNRGKVLHQNTMKAISEVETPFLGEPGCLGDNGGLRVERTSSNLSIESLAGAAQPRSPAFSLLELLVVMAVIAIMLALLLPAITGFNRTAGRRGAVNTLMNTFEQARVAALEAGRPVYVVFRRRVFPEPDAIMVFRQPEDTTVANWRYEQLTKWIKLPKTVLLHKPGAGESILSDSLIATDEFDVSRVPNPPLLASDDRPLKVLTFNESGGVSVPSDKAYRKLIITEGVRDSSGTEALVGTKGIGGFEIISLSRSTGRSQLDVTTIQ